MIREMILPFNGRLLTGPLDDLSALQSAIRRNAPDPANYDRLAADTRAVLDYVAQHTTDTHAHLVTLADGTRAVFVRRCPPGYSVESIGRAVLRADDAGRLTDTEGGAPLSISRRARAAD